MEKNHHPLGDDSIKRRIPGDPYFFFTGRKGQLGVPLGSGAAGVFPRSIVLGLHVLPRPKGLVANEAVEGRIERIDVADVGLLRNFQTCQVVDRVNEQAPQSLRLPNPRKLPLWCRK